MTENDWVDVLLINVGVGTEGPWGLSDEVPDYSDCNRAHQHLFRAEDHQRPNLPLDQGDYRKAIPIRVQRRDLHRLGPNTVIQEQICGPT